MAAEIRTYIFQCEFAAAIAQLDSWTFASSKEWS